MFDDLNWLNPPASWSEQESNLTVETGSKTDFWNKTHYGFTRSDGHFLYKEVAGDFSCEVTLHGQFECLYDQLGLMVRQDDDNWLKTGLEYSDDAIQLSTVLTRSFSDWSMRPVTMSDAKDGITIRLTRHGSTLRVQQQCSDGTWQLLRLGHLDLEETCQVGMMCCSPERAGFNATFSNFRVLPAIPHELHN